MESSKPEWRNGVRATTINVDRLINSFRNNKTEKEKTVRRKKRKKKNFLKIQF